MFFILGMSILMYICATYTKVFQNIGSKFCWWYFGKHRIIHTQIVFFPRTLECEKQKMDINK
jgi:hypothetical protein